MEYLLKKAHELNYSNYYLSEYNQKKCLHNTVNNVYILSNNYEEYKGIVVHLLVGHNTEIHLAQYDFDNIKDCHYKQLFDKIDKIAELFKK